MMAVYDYMCCNLYSFEIVVNNMEMFSAVFSLYWCEQFAKVCCGAQSVRLAGLYWNNWLIMC